MASLAEPHSTTLDPPTAAVTPPPVATPRRPLGAAVRLAWAVPVIAFVAFIAFGTIPIEGGWFPGQRSDRVLAVWADYGNQLSDSVTQTSLKEVGLYALLGSVLFFAAVGFWLALTTGDSVTPPSDDQIAA